MIGYVTGIGCAALYYGATAIKALSVIMTVIETLSLVQEVIECATNVIFAIVYGVTGHKTQMAIYAGLATLCLIDILVELGIPGKFKVKGPKGSVEIDVDISDVKPSPKFGDDDLVYGPSANLKLRELQQSAGGKLLTDTGGPFDRNCDSWLSYSKIIMDETVEVGNKIHFDLTYMDDIDNILNNTGPYADSVTSGELRYIRDNWSRFDGFVKFYKDGSEVLPPWMK